LLIATLAHALLREGAGFHAYQIFETGVRQFDEWADPAVSLLRTVDRADPFSGNEPRFQIAHDLADKPHPGQH
jgi:hypothetical protein